MIAAPTMPAEMREDADPLSLVARKLEEVKDAMTKKPAVPPWLVGLVIYLVGQLVGSVWWAATMQSDVRYLQQENLKLWQKVETHDLQLGQQKEQVRNAVKEAMADSSYVRVGKKGDD